MIDQMRRVDFRRVFVITSLGILILSYALLWLRMITTPIQYTGTDFVAFYAAARIAKIEGTGHIYDVGLQQKYEEALIGEAITSEIVRIYLNPPFVVPLVQAIALDNFVLSLILWNGMMLAFLIAGTLFLIPLLRGGFSKKEWPIVLAGILFFFPGYKSLVVGQNSAMLYFGACAWMAGVLMKKDWLGGLGLAVMTVRPHLALPLALAFLFSKRRGIWWWFLLGVIFLAGFSLVYMGINGVEGFLRILAFSGSGVNLTTGENNMLNLIGLLMRLMPGIPTQTIRWIGWGVYFAAMLGLCIYWARRPAIGEREISLAVILGMLTTPHLHLHDFVLLVVPLASFIILARRKHLLAGDIILVPLAISLAFLLSFFAESLQSYIPYVVMLVLFLLVWFPDKIFSRREDPKEGVMI
jgi:hypothetical protein